MAFSQRKGQLTLTELTVEIAKNARDDVSFYCIATLSKFPDFILSRENTVIERLIRKRKHHQSLMMFKLIIEKWADRND